MFDTYFLKMLQHLRAHEEIMLFGNVLQIEEKGVEEYLISEYQREILNYPYSAPKFNCPSALWAAKTLYLASQFMLYRENKPSELLSFFPDYSGEINSEAILSADLFLRFLPDIITQLKLIDPEDELTPILERHIILWHYSNLKIIPKEKYAQLDFTEIQSDSCLLQLYADRVIENKKLELALFPALQPKIKECLGNYSQLLWKDFYIQSQSTYE